MAAVKGPRLCVCVFAKPPRAGLVKTRLIPELGPDAAARLARAFFDDVWAAMSSIGWADPVLATTEVAAPEWTLPPGACVWPQGDGDLGQRMERVLRRGLETHAGAIAIGTDSPGLPRRILDTARAALDRHDAVIGPSDDGGFYLLGVRRYPAGLLDDVPWSSRETCARTMARLGGAGLSVAVLPRWFDVDTVDDLRRLHEMRDELDEAPETVRVVEALLGREREALRRSGGTAI